MTSPLNGYAIVDGTWYEIGPVDDRGNGLVIVASEADPESLAEVMSTWEERVVDLVREVAPEPCPEDLDDLAARISETLWGTP